MRFPLDRRVAVIALVVAVVVVAVTITAAHSPPARDDRARRELLALARRQDRASWLVEFDFTRTLANGEQLREAVTEANRPPVHVLSSGTTVTVDFGARTASCTNTDKGPKCIEQADDPSLASSAVYREVTALGAYRVERLSGATFAGEPARCFALAAVARPWPQLGDRTEQCYARDGVPLHSSIRRGQGVDSRDAVRVIRNVGARRLAALVGRLDRERGASGG